MGKIIVLKTEGKGRSGADFVTVVTFETIEKAQKYCKENTKDGKYWSFAEIINEGERIEPWYMENI